MKKYPITVCLLFLSALAFSQAAIKTDDTKPVYPGEPGTRGFWNTYSERFIYAPVFDMPKVAGAVTYKFTIKSADGQSKEFTADKPWAALSPVWDEVPEGYANLTVEGMDASGKVVGKSGERAFYRSPAFAGNTGKPDMSYLDAGRWGLKAIYDAPHVQYWLANNKPDPNYARYCYPNKIVGGLMRGMVAFSKIAEKKEDRDAALKIARANADYLISIAYPPGSPFAFIPPTYTDKGVNKPVGNSSNPIKNKWFMVPSSIDPALGFLDLYDATHNAKYLNAAKAIAATLLKRQDADGTWPYMADYTTGKPVVAQRLIPTWIIFFFDRLDEQYKITAYRAARAHAWKWITQNPLKTYQWDGQFEDVKPRPPYVNLAREQACDVATLLMEDGKNHPQSLAQADELLRFAEDQFVAWSPVKDPLGWHRAMPDRRNNAAKWITPCVLEQYACYDPVARSSAILINAYLKAYDITKKPVYLDKAKALTNALLAGQQWQNETNKTNGEIPTWVMKTKPINWLNNSYYAADAVLNMARH